MTELLHQELTRQIIGVYYDIYNALGHTYPEYVYERAMLLDLQDRGIPCQQQVEYRVFYKDKLVGVQQLDLLVADKIVIELKVAPEITRLHKAQIFSYLKTSQNQVGLLFNFGSQRPGFERLYYSEQPIEEPGPDGLSWQSDLVEGYLYPEVTDKIIAGIFEVHSSLGPGFIHRIYAKALFHELVLTRLSVAAHHEYQVIYRDRPVGEIKFNHLQIGDHILLFPVAVQDISSINTDNLKTWMRYRNISLGILANFHAPSAEFKVLRV